MGSTETLDRAACSFCGSETDCRFCSWRCTVQGVDSDSGRPWTMPPPTARASTIQACRAPLAPSHIACDFRGSSHRMWAGRICQTLPVGIRDGRAYACGEGEPTLRRR